MKKEKKSKKIKPPKIVKPVLTELQLAERQANRMLKDMERLQATQTNSPDQKKVREGVDLWKDSDFFFSVVFQSGKQKYDFLKAFAAKFNVPIEGVESNETVIQVINGLKLSKNMGIDLIPEKVVPYPYPNLELAKLALDDEKL